jgi:hypothetical protein
MTRVLFCLHGCGYFYIRFPTYLQFFPSFPKLAFLESQFIKLKTTKATTATTTATTATTLARTKTNNDIHSKRDKTFAHVLFPELKDR